MAAWDSNELDHVVANLALEVLHHAVLHHANLAPEVLHHLHPNRHHHRVKEVEVEARAVLMDLHLLASHGGRKHYSPHCLQK